MKLDNLIPSEIINDNFSEIISELSSLDTVLNILEIGSSSGQGSTKNFIESISKRKDKNLVKFFCLEISKKRFENLQNYLSSFNFAYPFNYSSVPKELYPSKDEIINFYHNRFTKLNLYHLNDVLDWLDQEIKYLEDSNLNINGIIEIKQKFNIDNFDLCLIDGSEFTGKIELQHILGSDWILLDDTETYKSREAFELLINNNDYILWDYNPNLRNGYAVFRNVKLNQYPKEKIHSLKKLEGSFNTHFFNNHGLAYSCDVHPKLLKSDTKFIYTEDYRNIKNGDTVYVITSALQNWFKLVYQKLLDSKIEIILVTGDSDLSAPLSLFNINDPKKLVDKILSDGVIRHWFTQNCDYPEHPQITPIPIGIDYHTLHRKSWKNESRKCFNDQDQQLVNLTLNSLSFESWSKKNDLIFSDAHLSKNNNLIDREEAFNISNKNPLFFNLESPLPRTSYWNELSKYKYALSPLGNGIDCHRTWEILTLGIIPIIKNTSIKPVFGNLPIIYVDSYSEINRELLLNHTYPTVLNQEDENRLYLKHWQSLIKTK